MSALDPARASVRRGLFGGEGEVRVWDLGARTSPFTAVLWCELEPRGRVGAHRQERDAEVVIVVEGRCTIVVGGARTDAGPGTAVPLALGDTLAIENGPATLRYLIVKANGPA